MIVYCVALVVIVVAVAITIAIAVATKATLNGIKVALTEFDTKISLYIYTLCCIISQSNRPNFTVVDIAVVVHNNTVTNINRLQL